MWYQAVADEAQRRKNEVDTYLNVTNNLIKLNSIKSVENHR